MFVYSWEFANRSRRAGPIAGGAAAAAFLSTTFTGNENPLSEGGAFTQPVPSVWTNAVKKLGGVAIDGGTAAGTNDAVAALTGTWPAHVKMTVVASVAGSIGTSECEVLFRMQWTGSTLKLYECDFTPSGVALVRWNGTQGDFTILTLTNGTTGSYTAGVSDGDTFECEINDNAGNIVLTVKQNGTLVAQAADDTGLGVLASGPPGIGFDNGNGNFGWTSLVAQGL